MKKDELTEFLQRQNEYLQGRLDEALASVNSLTLANEKLVATVDELRMQIVSLEDVIKGKGAELSKEKAARQAVQRLQGSPSERQAKPTPAPADAARPDAPLSLCSVPYLCPYDIFQRGYLPAQLIHCRHQLFVG